MAVIILELMKSKHLIFILPILLALASFSFSSGNECLTESSILEYKVNPLQKNLKFYWKDANGKPYKSLGNLKADLEKNGQVLTFAMNGGMYRTDNSPLGLFIEKSEVKVALNKSNGTGNFYLQPNGVFYLTNDGNAGIVRTIDFKLSNSISYATQSGPMLVTDGQIHPDFKEGSTNLNIRNGVGILPDGQVLFAMSKAPINFFDFASYFKNAGCKNALYLDGFVSRAYVPGLNWLQTDGNFGVIIAASTEK